MQFAHLNSQPSSKSIVVKHQHLRMCHPLQLIIFLQLQNLNNKACYIVSSGSDHKGSGTLRDLTGDTVNV